MFKVLFILFEYNSQQKKGTSSFYLSSPGVLYPKEDLLTKSIQMISSVGKNMGCDPHLAAFSITGS